MQASKIIIGKIYAIKNSEKGLRRMKAECIVTERFGTSAAQTTNKVKGYAFDSTDEATGREELVVFAKDILGPYDEHKELVDKVRAEKEKHDQIMRERELLLKRAGTVLARLLGVPLCDYRQQRHRQHDPSIEITYHRLEIDLGVLDKVLALGERLGITVSDEELFEKAETKDKVA